MLEQITLSISEEPPPLDISLWIKKAREAVVAFQDVWDRESIEQFVAADYDLVYRALREISLRRLMIGHRFCEWGCGFGTVTLLAASLGWDAIGIEAEAELLRHARQLAADSPFHAEFVQGNFLPPAAERFADDPLLPSLSHPQDSAYGLLGLEIDDFALIYAYPWPGEEFFFESIFTQYAQEGALLLLFCGAYDIRLYRKLQRTAPTASRAHRRR